MRNPRLSSIAPKLLLSSLAASVLLFNANCTDTGGGDPPATIQLQAPTWVTGGQDTSTPGQITVLWNQVPNATGYIIYIATSANLLSPTLPSAAGGGVSIQNITGGNMTLYTIAGLSNGDQRWFRVVANGTTNTATSDPSTQDNATAS